MKEVMIFKRGTGDLLYFEVFIKIT